MCCLHGVPNPSPGHGLLSLAPLPQRCWDPDSSSALQPPAPCPPISSPVPFIPTQAKCTHGTAAHTQPAASHLVTTPYLHQQHHVVSLPDNQVNTDGPTHSQCQRKLSICTSLQQELSHVSDSDMMSKGICEDRCRLDETCGLANLVEGRELLDKEKASGQHQQHFQVSLAAEQRKEQQRTRAVLTTRDTRDGRVRANYTINSIYIFILATICLNVLSGILPSNVCFPYEVKWNVSFIFFVPYLPFVW